MKTVWNDVPQSVSYIYIAALLWGPRDRLLPYRYTLLWELCVQPWLSTWQQSERKLPVFFWSSLADGYSSRDTRERSWSRSRCVQRWTEPCAVSSINVHRYSSSLLGDIITILYITMWRSLQTEIRNAIYLVHDVKISGIVKSLKVCLRVHEKLHGIGKSVYNYS